MSRNRTSFLTRQQEKFYKELKSVMKQKGRKSDNEDIIFRAMPTDYTKREFKKHVKALEKDRKLTTRGRKIRLSHQSSKKALDDKYQEKIDKAIAEMNKQSEGDEGLEEEHDQVQEAYKTSEQQLREDLIRTAYNNPEIRDDILPLVEDTQKRSSYDPSEWPALSEVSDIVDDNSGRQGWVEELSKHASRLDSKVDDPVSGEIELDVEDVWNLFQSLSTKTLNLRRLVNDAAESYGREMPKIEQAQQDLNMRLERLEDGLEKLKDQLPEDHDGQQDIRALLQFVGEISY